MLLLLRYPRLLGCALLLLTLLPALPTPALAQTVTPAQVHAGFTIKVNTLVDEWDTDPAKAPQSKCSLREALQATTSGVNGNQGCGSPSISNFDEFTLDLMPGTYLLTYNDQLPNLNKKVTIDGKNTVIIDGNSKGGRQHGIFIIGGGALELSKLKLQYGWRPFGGAIWMKSGSGAVSVKEVEFYRNLADNNSGNGDGGAVVIDGGSFTCIKSKFNENTARWSGGAISAGNAQVLIDRCEFFRNHAEVNGGAFAAYGGSEITHPIIRDSKFRENWVSQVTVPATWPGQYQFGDDQSGGGAIYNKGFVEIERTEIFKNYSQRSKGGGAIYNQGDLRLYDVAISDNKARPDDKVPMTLGGAILNDSTLIMLRTSIHDNEAKFGGAILNRTAGRLYIVNSTVADNLAVTGGGVENGHNFAFNGQATLNPGGEIHIWHSTLVRNRDSNQNSVNLSANGNGSIYLGNSLLDSECFGTIYSHGGNIIKKKCDRISADNNTDLTLTDLVVNDVGKIGLEGLSNNGGPNLPEAEFLSIKVNGQSPALDLGRDEYCTDPALAGFQVTKDQIQGQRPNGPKCDAGAMEVGTLPPKLFSQPKDGEFIVFPVTIFGKVWERDTTLFLKNEGGGSINWQVVIEDNGGGVFSQVDGPTSGGLARDQSVTLTYRCAPTTLGYHVGSLLITTDLPDQSEIHMPLSCAMKGDTSNPYAWGPQNPPGPVNGGSVPPGGTRDTLLNINNQGADPLGATLNLKNGLADTIKFSAGLGAAVTAAGAQTDVTIPGGMTLTVKITCAPTAPGLYANTLEIKTNDPINPILNYDIACEGVTVPSPEKLAPSDTALDLSNRSYMGMALSPDGQQLLAGQWETNQIIPYAVNSDNGFLNKQNAFSQPNMTTITGIRYSSDGKNVYYASFGGDGVGVINRAADGTLSAAQTITRTQPIICGLIPGNPPLLKFCPWNAMDGARALDISPDDQHVYVTGSVDATLTVLARNPADGKLGLTQKITRTIEGVDLLAGAFGVLVSLDGQNVYVAGRDDNAVVAFTRMSDGRLRYLTHYLDGDGLAPRTAISIAQPIELAISPDGHFLYVTSLGDDAVQIFRRNPADGFIEPVEALPVGNDPYHVAVSHDPDGERLLVALWHGDAVKVFARDRVTGKLAPVDGQADLPMDGAVFLVASRDDRHVYATLFEGSGVSHLRSVKHTPALFALSPASLAAGSGDSLLQVQGERFYPDSQVLINGAPAATNFVNEYRLTAIVPQTLLGAAGTLNVQVRTPIPGGGDANTLALAVLAPEAPPIPSVASLSPAAASVGGEPLNVVVTGAGFTPQSQALLNGGLVQTTFLNPTKLLLELQATDVVAPGPLVITVVNGGASVQAAQVNAGESSLPVKFEVVADNRPAQASISSFAPASVAAGSAEQWLTVHGHNFSQLAEAPSLALWHGAARETRVQDERTLQVLLTAADLASAGEGAITIRTPGVADSDPAQLPILPAGQNPIARVETLASEGTQLLVSGSDFVDGAQIRRNGQPLATTFVNPFVLVATVTWGDLGAGGVIDVVNPGAAASNGAMLAPQDFVFLPVLAR